MLANRRRHPRVPLKVRCWCESDAITLYAPLVNVSEGGLFIRTLAPLQEGVPATVRFPLDSDGRYLDVRAVVVWVKASDVDGTAPGMGLRFIDLDEETARALRELVERVNAKAGR